MRGANGGRAGHETAGKAGSPRNGCKCSRGEKRSRTEKRRRSSERVLPTSFRFHRCEICLPALFSVELHFRSFDFTRFVCSFVVHRTLHDLGDELFTDCLVLSSIQYGDPGLAEFWAWCGVLYCRLDFARAITRLWGLCKITIIFVVPG